AEHATAAPAPAPAPTRVSSAPAPAEEEAPASLPETIAFRLESPAVQQAPIEADLEPTSRATVSSDEVGLSVTLPSLQPDPSRAHPPITNEARGARPPRPEEIDALLKRAQEQTKGGDQ